MAEAPRTREGREGAVDRAFDVLETLVATGRTTSLADIADGAHVPKSTAHRILQILVERGYAQQLGDGAYSSGLKMLSLAGQLDETLNLAELARPVMLGLQGILPETIHLALLQGDHATYVAKVEGRRAYRMASTIGTNLALHSTAIGKAILAFLPDEQRHELLGNGRLPARTYRTITTARLLAAELELIRGRGFAIDDEENEDQIRCVGAAIFDRRGKVVGGLSVSAPAFAMSSLEALDLGPAVVRAAATVSCDLGTRRERLPAAYRLEF